MDLLHEPLLWASWKQWSFHPLGLHNTPTAIKSSGPSLWPVERSCAGSTVGVGSGHSLDSHERGRHLKRKAWSEMCQKAAPLLKMTFSVLPRWKCVWDAGGGFAGIGRLKLMPDCSRRGRRGLWKCLLSICCKETCVGIHFTAWDCMGLIISSLCFRVLPTALHKTVLFLSTAQNYTFDAQTAHWAFSIKIT